MELYDIVITDLQVREDTIYQGKPYISKKPRAASSIAYISEGSLSYATDKKEYCVGPGTVFTALCGETDISSAEKGYVKYIYFDFFTIDPLQTSVHSLDRVNLPLNPQAYEKLFRRALDIWNSRIFGYAAQCREILYTIINRLVSENYAKSESYYKYNKIRAAIQKIETDFNTPVTVKELADLCSMSEGNLSRLFKKITGMNPTRYLCETRINNAKRLLELGEFNISEIASRCGYSDVYSFSRAFRRVFGVPPSRYK